MEPVHQPAPNRGRRRIVARAAMVGIAAAALIAVAGTPSYAAGTHMLIDAFRISA
jgi:uncharacterized protein involved in exopolysaccharide biosynthesis